MSAVFENWLPRPWTGRSAPQANREGPGRPPQAGGRIRFKETYLRKLVTISWQLGGIPDRCTVPGGPYRDAALGIRRPIRRRRTRDSTTLYRGLQAPSSMGHRLTRHEHSRETIEVQYYGTVVEETQWGERGSTYDREPGTQSFALLHLVHLRTSHPTLFSSLHPRTGSS